MISGKNTPTQVEPTLSEMTGAAISTTVATAHADPGVFTTPLASPELISRPRVADSRPSTIQPNLIAAEDIQNHIQVK